MIIIVKYRAFDRDHEKNFYNGESWLQIHEALHNICWTYLPTEVITCTPDHTQPTNLEYLKRQKDEKI